MNINVVASIVTVFSTLLTALYGSGGFDIWDLSIGLFVIYIACSFRREFSQDPRAFRIVQVGVGIAGMIVLMTLTTAISRETAGLMEKKFLNETVNWFFIATVVSVLISFIVFKRASPTPKEGG
jgi:hydrogenase-4 membrane subunit HyfE